MIEIQSIISLVTKNELISIGSPSVIIAGTHTKTMYMYRVNNCHRQTGFVK